MPINITVPAESEKKTDISISTDNKTSGAKDFINIVLTGELNTKDGSPTIAFPNLPTLDK